MRKKGSLRVLFLVFLLTLSIGSSCALWWEPPALMFDPLYYPSEKFYIGVGIVRDKDRGKAKQAAKMLAITDLASQMETTVTSTKTASTFDNGTEQDLTYAESIQESLYQEFEEIIYLEEAYTSKKEQTTYAIIKRDDWEAQKARKILAEQKQAQAILLARYPDIPPVREITILNDAKASLERTRWGALVEGTFDDAYGFLLPMIKARREILYARVRYSNLYHISESLSQTSLMEAKDHASRQLQAFLTERLCKEYESLRVRVSSGMESAILRDEITRYVPYAFSQHPNLMEYIEGQNSTEGLFSACMIVSKTAWEEQKQRAIDELYQQVKKLEQAFHSEISLSKKLDLLTKTEELLGTSFFGLAVENSIFPHQDPSKRSIPSLRGHLVDSVKLSLDATRSVEEGQTISVRVALSGASDTQTVIPILCRAEDDTGKQRYLETIHVPLGDSHDIIIATDKNEKAKSLQVSCYWTQFPQQRAETIISITKAPILTRIKRFLSLGKK